MLLDRIEQADFFFAAGIGQHRNVGLSLGAQVHQERSVAAVVQDHVRAFFGRAFGAAEFENAVGVVPVVVQVFAFVGKHRRAFNHQRRSGMVLRRVNIAAGPAHISAQGLQGFDQHAGLNGHVQRAGDARALERLRLGKLFANGHQAGHFGFGDTQFLAAPVGKRQVGNSVILVVNWFDNGIHGISPKQIERAGQNSHGQVLGERGRVWRLTRLDKAPAGERGCKRMS